MAAFWFVLGWGILALFFLSLIRAGAKPVPAPKRWSMKRCGATTFRLRVVLGQLRVGKKMCTPKMYPLEPFILESRDKPLATNLASESQTFRFAGFL